jgi:hypothetical protein
MHLTRAAVGVLPPPFFCQVIYLLLVSQSVSTWSGHQVRNIKRRLIEDTHDTKGVSRETALLQVLVMLGFLLFV